MRKARYRKALKARNYAFMLLVLLAILAMPTIISETLLYQQTHSSAPGPSRLTPYRDVPELLKGE